MIRHYTKRKYRLLPARSSKIIMLKLKIEGMTGKGNRP
jgi:hypothetical protein